MKHELDKMHRAFDDYREAAKADDTAKSALGRRLAMAQLCVVEWSKETLRRERVWIAAGPDAHAEWCRLDEARDELKAATEELLRIDGTERR